MKELNEYRKALINRLISRANDFRTACLAVKDPFAPLEVNGWNTHQVAAHVRDVDRIVYGLRARQTITTANPVFQNFDGDTHMREHYAPNESLQKILDEFVNSVDDLASLLRAQPAAAWARVSSHEKLGNDLTLQLWVERNLAHIGEHLETVGKR